MSPVRNPNTSTSIESELLRLLSRQSWLGPIPVLLALALIAYFASSYFSPMIWGGWLALCALFLFLRSAILIRLPKLTSIPARERLKWAIVLSLINGCFHASSLFFFPYFSDLERALQTLVITGIGTITVITTAGYFKMSLAYLCPTVIPLIALWATVPYNEGQQWLGFAVAWLVLQVNVIMLWLSADTYGLFSESFDIRQQQDRMNEKLSEALQEAESASRSKTRFLASASHDLRQPIHALSLFGGALMKRPLDESSKDIAKHMDLALQSLISRLDSLLDISKLDAGIIPVNETLINLRLMAERLQDEFRPSAELQGLSLWLDCADDAFVYSDEELLERVVRNLVANAIKYTDSGRIDISIDNVGDNIEFVVADSGRGIPAEEQRHVFEEFYQLSNPERDQNKGLGLGLAIVKRVTDLLDIQLDMDSRVGVGTTFTVTIPSASSQSHNETQRPSQRHSWKNLCALVVDDEREVGMGMKVLLEEIGCRVLLADSTMQAISVAKAERPDVILADFRLRGEDNGILTIRSVRSLHADCPALLISGDTAPERLREAEQTGIKLLHKPVLVDELEQAISEVCNYHQQGVR